MGLKNQITTCNALTWEQAQELVEHLKATDEYRFALLTGIGFYTGLRIGDILKLRWNQLLNTSVLDIKERKTKKIRRIFLNEKVQKLILLCHDKMYLKYSGFITPDNYVFINRSGAKPISVQYVDRMLPVFLNEINIPCKSAGSHTLRKTFGKRIYEAGQKTEHALIMVSELLHHSSCQVSRVYCGISQSDYKQAYLGL